MRRMKVGKTAKRTKRTKRANRARKKRKRKKRKHHPAMTEALILLPVITRVRLALKHPPCSLGVTRTVRVR